MAWSEAVVVCRKHPNENPQPGVCPSCLRERLSRIAGNSRTYNTCSFSPSFSASPVYYCYSSASSSGCGSPAANRHRGHQRVVSDVMDSIYLAISGRSTNGLKKSRSMVFASRNEARDGVNRKKKGGFWNKLLLRSSGKKAKF
ncbi:hypothetical protein Pfo_007853 [Paulownia fortunei]|nr:hypothetical protein Pfo_007853 [Paulownia fortunei]